MSIHPDQDKQSCLTGQYRVVVQHKGTRARRRSATFADAQVADKQWKLALPSTLPSSTPKAPSRIIPMTLGQFFDSAKDSIRRGKSTEEATLQRCMAAIAYLGALGRYAPSPGCDPFNQMAGRR
jgi:hypothetical protein